MFSSIFDLELAFYYDIPTYSVKNSDTTDRYGHIITVGGVGGDFSHTQDFFHLSGCPVCSP